MRTATLTLALAFLALGLLGAGCPPAKPPDLTRAHVERGTAALEEIKADAAEATICIDRAKVGTARSAEEVRDTAQAAAAIPAAMPVVKRLEVSADRLAGQVIPDLDQARTATARIQTSSADAALLLAAVAQLEDRIETQARAAAESVKTLEGQIAEWQAEAARQKERADGAVRKWLVMAAAAGFSGLLAGAALFIWVSRKTGLIMAGVSLAVFATAVALHRWLDYIAWAGLGLLALTLAGLAYAIWKNRDAFKTVVAGGQGFKASLQAGAQYTADQILDLFRTAHEYAQETFGTADVTTMVADAKGKEET